MERDKLLIKQEKGGTDVVFAAGVGTLVVALYSFWLVGMIAFRSEQKEGNLPTSTPTPTPSPTRSFETFENSFNSQQLVNIKN